MVWFCRTHSRSLPSNPKLTNQTGLADCFLDLPICLSGCLCPCCLFGGVQQNVSNNVGPSKNPCSPSSTTISSPIALLFGECETHCVLVAMALWHDNPHHLLSITTAQLSFDESRPSRATSLALSCSSSLRVAYALCFTFSIVSR